jgi:EAL domain-containing protein (putative c-di-GMP-specific phosphodiesterase class I)
LDDFGTGFSTLGILRELPVDIVKIDREYVKDIESSEIDQITVKSIADVAAAFNADVCVEGIETEGMIDRLKDYKVTSLQGYYFSKPIRFEEFMKKYFE